MKKQSNCQHEKNGVLLAIVLMTVVALLGKVTTCTPQWLTAKNSFPVVMMLSAAAVILVTMAVFRKVNAIKSNSKKVNNKV